MRKILLLLIVCLSFNARASGGFVCYDKDKKVSVEGILGRSAGDPISSVKFLKNKVSSEIPSERLIQYKSNADEFYLLALSSDSSQILFELNTTKKKDPNGRATKGSLVIKEPDNKKWNVVCDFE